MQNNQQFQTIFLATHCPANNVESFYAYSLADTIQLFSQHGYKVTPLFINDINSPAVAKNEVLSLINLKEFSSIIFIDYNIAWDASVLLDIVKSPYDAVAIPVVKKIGNGAIFDLDIGENIDRDQNGYIKVNFASSAMIKLSKKLVTDLCDSNLSIINPTGNEVKNVFETSTKHGKFFNESIILCNKIKELGNTIWINPVSTCANIASNVYAADFLTTLANQTSAPAPTTEEIKSLYE
jgi:hypothetical protein